MTGEGGSVGREQDPICRSPEQGGPFLLETSALRPTFPCCAGKGASSCPHWPHVNLAQCLPSTDLPAWSQTKSLHWVQEWPPTS